MSLELNLPAETEAQIRELAAASGQDVQAFVGALLAEKLAEVQPQCVSQSQAATTDAAELRLPEWCRVYDGLTDEQIDEIDRLIVRSPSSRDVA
jgi:hypothetical protein